MLSPVPASPSLLVGTESKRRHEVRERADGLDRQRVVDRRADPADAAMALELDEASLGRAREERRLELGSGETERHVHERARTRLGVPSVETVAPIDGVVQDRGLLAVALRHLVETADLVA